VGPNACRRASFVLLIALGGCTKLEVVGRTAPPPAVALDGNTYDVTTRSRMQFVGAQVLEARSNGDLVVMTTQQHVIPRAEVYSISRPRRARGYLYGFATTVAIGLALSAIAPIRAYGDDCSFSCNPDGRLVGGFALGVGFGAVIGGPIGAVIGAPEVYVFE
jgi:hypothetical protein